MLKTQWTPAGMETVTVTARGQVLESVTFDNSEDASEYKRSVRRWAFERGLLVRVWSRGRAVSGPESAPPFGMQPLAVAC
jgi:hypothetical protein